MRCYAEGLNKRCGGNNWGPGAERRTTTEQYWRQPLKWERWAIASGKRMRVFCGSMCDIFDSEAPVDTRARLFELIKQTPHLDWQLLSKRPGNFERFLPLDWGSGYENVWLGCTVEDRARAAQRVPALRSTPARTRFLSCEPLLEDLGKLDLSGIHWVIVGGESGGKARRFEIRWARNLQLQCEEQRIAFFCKQLGAKPTHNDIPLVIRNNAGRRDLHATDFEAWPREYKPLMIRQFPVEAA